ncbi:hypothetical protein [Saccharomonospora sp. NB11]|uniref:hypothetical protein n=1 Tax=Saccharomonospora sp. NB11 TaxID=1642298 RepID=UPI0027DE131B|nr:hypothetical protein [Saccharomonospora sp. NB11]
MPSTLGIDRAVADIPSAPSSALGLSRREFAVPDLVSTFSAVSDGVMTNEVGVITGDLELHTSCAEDGTLNLAIRYVGANEWYTLKGADYRLHDPRDHEVVHRLLVTLFDRPRAR